jgi:hypothetical protein
MRSGNEKIDYKQVSDRVGVLANRRMPQVDSLPPLGGFTIPNGRPQTYTTCGTVWN